VSVRRHKIWVVISKPYYILYYSKSHILTHAAAWYRRTVTLVVAYFIWKKKNTLYEMQCFVIPALSMLMPPLLLGIVQNGELRMKYSYCRASLKTLYSHGEKKHWKGEKILVPCRMHILCETNFSNPKHCLTEDFFIYP